MGNSCLENFCCKNNFLLCTVILSLVSGSLKFALALGNETDRLALLSLKDQLVGGSPDALNSWNSSLHFCEWQGVICGRRHQRVIALNLSGLRLSGSISPSIGNLTFLRGINLSWNRLQGNIPKELGRLRRLRALYLYINRLQGEIPVEITNCSNLQIIILNTNRLTGGVPSWFGLMPWLVRLSLAVNRFTGSIPAALGNISSLNHITLAINHLEGRIPEALNNRFTGTIPRSIANISSLQQFDIYSNGFSGSVPDNLGNLNNLQLLVLDYNNLGSGKAGDLDFISSLSNYSLLETLVIHKNRFGGRLPDSIANLSIRLRVLYMGENQITGSLPEGIGNLVNLNDINMGNLFLTGNIPVSMGKLQNLEGLSLPSNHLSGKIPSSVGNLSRLSKLDLSNNNFEGRILQSLANCDRMEQLDLSQNKLNGSIPNQLFGAFKSLFYLNLSHNSFTGLLPLDLGNLKNLVQLFLDNNKFFGEIPCNLGQSSGLRILYMQGNSFQVPKQGVFKNVSGFSFMGNKKLCGGILQLELPKCFDKEPKKRANVLSTKVITMIILSVLIASFLAVFLVNLCWKRRSRMELNPVALLGDGYLRMALPEQFKEIIDFRLLEQMGEDMERISRQQEAKILECLVSFTKIGVACSAEVPAERMRIKDAITGLEATKARLIHRTGHM
ncbi:hypothetical protein SCA6_000170 [Theobroma cacao]